MKLRFKRDVVNDKWFNEIGAASWNRTNYSVETPALIEKHKRKLLLHKFERINAESLSNETLEAILAIVNGERHE